MQNEVQNEVMDLLDSQCESAWGSMVHEMNTGDSAEYRRGFRAGRLIAALEMKADINSLIRLEESIEY